MKKIVRLTESDLVRLVKKVILENERLINEVAKETTMDNGTKLGIDNQGLLVVNNGQCRYKIWDQKSKSQVVLKGMEKIVGTFYDDYRILFKSASGDHDNKIPKAVLDNVASEIFACRASDENINALGANIRVFKV
jgi:hypothetical protein